MKKLITLLTICLLAVSAWGDVSVTETFSQIEQIAAVASDSWTADICSWSTAYARHRKGEKYIDDKDVEQTNEDVITVSGNPMYSVWMSAAADNKRGCIQTTNLEGGIKAVSFRWAQFGSESGNRLALEVKAGTIVDDSTTNADLKRVSGGANKISGGISYTHTFNCQTNGQLCIKNISKKGGDNACRILIGHISITPYLYYMQKEVTIGLPNKGYINRNLINNTGGLGSITYSIHDKNAETKNYADIDELTGAITPKAEGTAVVTASWEGVTTTYELTVSANTYLEAFSKNATYDSSTGTDKKWDGDVIPSWDVHLTTRRDQDSIGGYYVHGTYLQTKGNDDSNQGYLRTTYDVEGGVKAISYAWRQHPSGEGCTFRIAANYDEIEIAKNADVAGTAEGWTIQNVSGTNSTKLSNAILEIRNISNKGGSKDPRVILSPITITPWLLYYTKECTLDMQVASANPTRTFTNNDFINNTDASPTYSILGEPSIDVQIDAESGEVTVADRFQTGDIEVQAKWSEVTTKYTLHIIGKTASNASFAEPKVYKDISAGSFTIDCSKDAGTPSYTSSNTSIATVNQSTGEVTLVGVGQDTITVTIDETETIGGSTASYILYVRDANARKEQFSIVTANGVVGTTLTQWAGDLFEWQAQYQVRRKDGDNINEGTETPHLGTSIGIEDYSTTPKSSFLQSKAAVEGGIKHMSFYWAQWGAHKNCTRRIAVYAGEDLIGVGEHKNGVQGDEFLIGINHQVKSNEQLIFKNESYMGETYETKTSLSTADNSSRIVIGVIEITPYLFYSDKAHTMRLGDAPYTHSLTNNTGGNNISYSLVPDDSEVASIDPSTGEVTALKAGEVTIKATWDDEGAGAYTTYHLSIKPKLTSSTKVETFPNATDYTYKVGGVENNIQQSQCKWIVREAGFNSNENFEANVAFIRQKYDGQTKQSYIQTDENISGGINTLSFDWNIVGNEPDVTEWDIIAQIKQDDEVKKEIHLLSSAGGVLENVHKRNNGWRSTVLTDIDVTGDFIIRFENHSTINGTYTSGNKARFVIDNVEWKAANDISLADEDDNTEIIRDNDGKVADVQLADRTIRTGGYNTLCLPFDVSEETLQATLPGAKAYEFTNAYLSETNLDIRFDKRTALEAGKPYLVTVPADVTNPVFAGVTIDAESEDKNIIRGDNMRFIGSYNAGTMNETGLYVVADKLYRVESAANQTIGACRAYFDVLQGAAAVPKNIRMRIVAGQETATGLEEVGRETVNTVRSEKKIIDGQLIIIREGKMYNAQGMRIR